MNKKLTIIIAIAVLVFGAMGIGKYISENKEDPPITGIQAEFVGEIGPGEAFSKNMFEVKGITTTGKLVPLNHYTSKNERAANNGSTCEVIIESQGYETPVIVNITRTKTLERLIGYPEFDSVTVTCYKNGDLEFTGKGDIINFSTSFPWSEYYYSHVFIDESINIERMDGWFKGNQNLVYCTPLPKTLKTARETFAGCTSLRKTPDYFHCSNLKIMNSMFSGCSKLKELDILPVNVTSAKYTFEYCTGLKQGADLSKTSNLQNISGIHLGCKNLIEPCKIPESVLSMGKAFKDCINIQKATPFPSKVLYIGSTYAGCKGLLEPIAIPESVLDYTSCYEGCLTLSGNLEINTDTSAYSSVVMGANIDGDKLTLSGNCGNLLAIQKETGNSNIILANPEAAARQNERMLREQGF